MNEFLKLIWREDLRKIDSLECFLPEQSVANSYIYKSFGGSLPAQSKKVIKLKKPAQKYVPGKKLYRLIRRRSLLTKLQQRYCLMALKLIQDGKSQDSLTESNKTALKLYTECQAKIIEENRRFLQFAQNDWNRNSCKVYKCKRPIFNYSWEHWKEKTEQYLYYPQYYQGVSLLSLNYDESEATIHYQHVCNALELGTLARFAHPSLKEKCILKLKHLQHTQEEVYLNSKLPSSQDENVIKLLEKHQFDVVISSSALQQLIDYTNVNSRWIIPVIIKEITVDKGNGEKVVKKIVFIDKVLTRGNPTTHDLKYYAYKQLTKLIFCRHTAFSFPNDETNIHSTSEPMEPQESPSLDDDSEDKPTEEKSIHHNVSYRIWNVKKTVIQNSLLKNKDSDMEINLLIRCKLDACEETEQGILQPIVIRPKLEQQIQFGANIPSRSELSHDWTSLFFRLYSVLYRVRLYSACSEVISVEKCSLNKINSEAYSHYEYKPILGLGVLQKIMAELLKLKCGSYLLQHLPKHESFVSILQECEESSTHTYDLHAECGDIKVDLESKQSWLPIDVNYILPLHEEYNILPAVFAGIDKNVQKSKGKMPKTRMKQKMRKGTGSTQT